MEFVAGAVRVLGLDFENRHGALRVAEGANLDHLVQPGDRVGALRCDLRCQRHATAGPVMHLKFLEERRHVVTVGRRDFDDRVDGGGRRGGLDGGDEGGGRSEGGGGHVGRSFGQCGRRARGRGIGAPAGQGGPGGARLERGGRGVNGGQRRRRRGLRQGLGTRAAALGEVERRPDPARVAQRIVGQPDHGRRAEEVAPHPQRRTPQEVHEHGRAVADLGRRDAGPDGAGLALAHGAVPRAQPRADASAGVAPAQRARLAEIRDVVGRHDVEGRGTADG